MRIIQTLWLPEGKHTPLDHRCGWVSPEYHWMAWTLSVLQLRQHYDQVELYANAPAREVLIDRLQLPYTKVHAMPTDIAIPPSAWALAKILTYSRQEEPFLHVDGDVFIWKPFPEDLLRSALIAQNAEEHSSVYAQTMTEVKRTVTYLPPPFLPEPEPPVTTYNAGILGGHDLAFFREYARKAVDFVTNNPDGAPADVQASTFYCMLFEQWLFGVMAKEAGKSVATLFEEAADDLGYPGFSDFWGMPKGGYLHLMGVSKRNRFILKQLSSKVRQEYPQQYYHILRLCRDAGLALDFKVYQLPVLDPARHPARYFLDLLGTPPGFPPAGEDEKWCYFYAKDAYLHAQLEAFFRLDEGTRHEQILARSPDHELVETTEPELKQYLRAQDTSSLEPVDVELDGLEMLVFDALGEAPGSIHSIAGALKPYFASDDFSENGYLLKQSIEERIKKLMYCGAVVWLAFEYRPAQPLSPATLRNW
jgi:hypothetical protein